MMQISAEYGEAKRWVLVVNIGFLFVGNTVCNITKNIVEI